MSANPACAMYARMSAANFDCEASIEPAARMDSSRSGADFRHKDLARQKFEVEKHRQEEAAERQRRQAYEEAQV